MKREIRIPKQKRSIEKKNKIIESAYKIFNEKGYHNTNTAEIAKEAGLSTGCLYDYFIDKNDIFLEVLKMNNHNIKNIIHDKLALLPDDMDLLNIIQNLINIFIEVHNHSEGFHKEVTALSYTHDEINKFIKSYENETILNRLANYFEKRNIILNHKKEKMLLLLNTVDSLCHELVYNNNQTIDKDIYINQCAHMLETMIKS